MFLTLGVTLDSYIEFAKYCLKNPIVPEQLNSDTISKIQFYLEKYANFFPDEHEKHLVHADFDPANILVNKVGDTWKVTGILDWEFSFSGSVLCDVANMLRYAHHMPPQFEEAFLKGLNIQIAHLPKFWRISIHMLNLLSLLDCLMRGNPKNYPNQYTDIRKLIDHIIESFNSF